MLPELVVVPPRLPEELRTGWTVAPGDALGLAHALERALALDQVAYRAMAARARQFARGFPPLSNGCGQRRPGACESGRQDPDWRVGPGRRSGLARGPARRGDGRLPETRSAIASSPRPGEPRGHD